MLVVRPVSSALSLASLALVGTALAPTLSATFPTGTVEARGSCEVRPERVSCWDMKGGTAPDLADTVRAALSNGTEVGIRFGRKNRLLVVRHPQRLQVSYRTEGNDYLYSNISSNDEPRTEFLKVSTAPTIASITLRVQATVQSKSDAILPLKEGTRATVEGWTVEVGAARKTPPKGQATARLQRVYGYGYPTIPADADQWTVVFGLTGHEGESVNWTYTPLDDAGGPIRFVYAKGKPVTPVRALELEPSLQPVSGYNPNYDPGRSNDAPKAKLKAMAAVFQGGNSGPAFRATTNIDPRFIAALRIRASHVESADLGPFPLDPQPSGP